MRKLSKVIGPLLVIAAVVAIFFYPVWLQGKIPLPADFIVGVYYPWLDYKWAGFEAGVPVKNPITTDVVSFIFPMQIFAIEQLKQGIVPLWNNLILTGTPLLANFQSAPFSPTNFLYFVFPLLSAWSLQIILQPLLAAVFTYFLLREFHRSTLSAIVGSLCFSFAGFITIWNQWNGHSLVAAFFPLIFLLTYKLLTSNNLIYGVLLSISLCLQIFSGYPQIIIYEFLGLLGFVFLFRLNVLFSWGNILKILFFYVLGITLAAIQLIPGLELLTLSQRKIEEVINVSAFLPWQMIVTFLAPDYFGNHVTRNFWGPGDYTLVTGFSGVGVVILGALGTVKNFKDKFLKFGLFLVFLALFISLENPLSAALRNSGFLGLQAASAHRSLILANLGLSILAAFGLDTLISKNYRIRDIFRAGYIPLVILSSFTVFTAFLLIENKLGINWLGLQEKLNLTVGLKNLVFPWTIFWAVILGSVFVLKVKKFKKIGISFLAILMILELFKFGWKFTPFSPAELVFPKTPVIEFLQNQEKPFRANAENVIPINFMMAYGIETVEGYDAVYPLKYAKFLAVLNSGDVEATPMGRYGSVSHPSSPLLSPANTKYVLALKRDQHGKPDPQGNLPSQFQQTFLKPVFTDKSVVVLENTRALPRAIMFYNWQVEKNEQQTLNVLLKSDLSKKLFINTNLDFSPTVGQGTTKILTDTSSQKEISLQTNQPGLLFLSQVFYPGWRAYVDGKLTPIIEADYTFMAIPINTLGEHQVIVKYEPDSFEKGKMLSYIAGGILIALLFITIIRDKVRPGHFGSQ